MDREHTIIKTQVVIVGAGPTGLSMAAQLLRYDINFVIIEKNETTTPLSKAVVVQARTLEIFQELGIAEKAVKEGQVTKGLNLFYKGKRKAAVNLAGLGEGLSPFPFALSLEQSKTEKLLVDYLAVNGNAIRWKSEYNRFEQNENGVSVYYKDSAGLEQKIEAAYIVGCDGSGSIVRHQMGLSFEGNTVPKLFYVADVKLKSEVINKNELFIFLIKKGFILFFPMENKDHFRIVGILPEADIEAKYKFVDLENSIKEQVNVSLSFEEINWFSTYRVHSRKANSFVNGRAFIAGDAAHIHTPAGGQGMNTGIQDSYNLAWKISFVIRQEINPTILQTYNTERTENARHLLQTTDRMFDVMAGTTGFLNFVRLNFFPVLAGLITKSSFVKKRIFPLLSQIGISYPNSSLTIDSSIEKTRAGDRMPFFVFSDGKHIFEYLSEPCFKILFFGDNFTPLKNMKIKVVVYTFKEIPASLFGGHTNFYILLRPDNHISFIGKDFSKCRELLNGLSLNI